MNGREVFRHAVIRLAEAVDEALAANGLERRDVDWLVPHQANLRIIDAMGRKLGLPPERVVVTVDRHANTSAASVPLALAEARADGRIRSGDLVLMEALGGGLRLREGANGCDERPWSMKTAGLWQQVDEKFGSKFKQQTDIRRGAFVPHSLAKAA